MKKILQDYLHGGFAGEQDQSLLRRVEIIHIFTPFPVLLLAVFTYLSFADPRTYWIGYLMLADLVAVILNIPVLRRTKNVSLASHVLVFLAVPIHLAWLITGGVSGLGFFWTIPWLAWAFLLVGRKQGALWVLATVVYSWILLTLSQMNIVTIAYSPAELAQVYFMMGVAASILFLYDRQREFFEKRLTVQVQETELEREKFATLIESIGDGVVAIDRAWKIILWNKAASDLTGWSIEEALGKQLRGVLKLVRESDKTENITFIEETMLLGKAHYMENHTLLIRKDGREISVGDSSAPVFDKNGQVTGAIIVFRDISKEYELESTRQEFASLATHQLRTPITVIQGNVNMLLDGKVPGSLTGDQKMTLEDAKKAAEVLHSLVNAMLSVSRVESGKIAITPEPLYVPDLADEAARELSSQIEAKKLQLDKLYGKGIPVIDVDPKLTNAIILNLLSNAVKYTPAGGKVTLKIEKQNEELLIAVSDTGIGIPKAQQSRLFAKFFRADNAQGEQTEGTGLGLYIVKSIVEQSGGKIWFESEENKGSTFFITIPLSGMKKREGMKGLT